MSYEADPTDVGFHLAETVDMVLRGTNPGDIPIYRPTKFWLSLNLATAKAIGIEMPPMLLLIAGPDRVFE